MIRRLEALLEWGGTRRDIAFLAVSGLALLASILGLRPFPFDMAWFAIVLCGVLTGLGGMYLSMGYMDMFVRDMVAGRGFIALAACSMGQATPIGALVSSLVFAFFDGLSNVLQVLQLPSQFVQMLPYVATIVGLTIFSIQKSIRAKQKMNKIKAG